MPVDIKSECYFQTLLGNKLVYKTLCDFENMNSVSLAVKYMHSKGCLLSDDAQKLIDQYGKELLRSMKITSISWKLMKSESLVITLSSHLRRSAIWMSWCSWTSVKCGRSINRKNSQTVLLKLDTMVVIIKGFFILFTNEITKYQDQFTAIYLDTPLLMVAFALVYVMTVTVFITYLKTQSIWSYCFTWFFNFGENVENHHLGNLLTLLLTVM